MTDASPSARGTASFTSWREVLVAAGIEDRGLCVTFTGVAGQITFGSFAALTPWTLTEGSTTGLHRTRRRVFGARLRHMGRNKVV